MTKAKSYEPTKKRYNTTAFLGIYEGEEYYLRPVTWDCDWYFGGIYLEGLRPETEETLRERARNIEPEDLGIDTKACGQWFDYDKFEEDMEDNWYDDADVTQEVKRNGETIYLTFGTHTHYDSNILDLSWKEFTENFEETPLSEAQFNDMQALAKQFYALKKNAEKQHQHDMKAYRKTCAAIEDVLQKLELLCDGIAKDRIVVED